MKHTIIGEKGFIGISLFNYLKSEGLECQAISPTEFISSKFDSDILYFCIGLTSDFAEHTKRTLDSHVNLLLEVLQTHRFRRLVYLSSARIYMDSEHTSEEASITLSTDATNNIYMLSKLLGEALVRSPQFSNCRIVRLSNVVGPHQPTTTLLGNFIESSRQGKLIINESSFSGRDYVAIDDVVRLLFQIGVQSQSQIYNISSNQLVAHSEIVEYIRECRNADIRFSDNIIGPHRGTRISNDKVKSEFGWEFKDIQAYLRNIIKGEL